MADDAQRMVKQLFLTETPRLIHRPRAMLCMYAFVFLIITFMFTALTDGVNIILRLIIAAGYLYVLWRFLAIWRKYLYSPIIIAAATVIAVLLGLII